MTRLSPNATHCCLTVTVPLHKRQRIIHTVLLQELDPDDASEEERHDCRLRTLLMSVYSRLLSQSEVYLPLQLWKYFDQKRCPFLLMGGMRTCPAKDLRQTSSLSKPERAHKFQVTNHESSSCHRWKGGKRERVWAHVRWRGTSDSSTLSMALSSCPPFM
jgi:hypothetical protein